MRDGERIKMKKSHNVTFEIYLQEEDKKKKSVLELVAELTSRPREGLEEYLELHDVIILRDKDREEAGVLADQFSKLGNNKKGSVHAF